MNHPIIYGEYILHIFIHTSRQNLLGQSIPIIITQIIQDYKLVVSLNNLPAHCVPLEL